MSAFPFRPAACLLPCLFLASLQAQASSTPEPEVSSLEPLVVTATRTEREAAETPVRIELVTREEIDRTHAKTLKQALENVPGLQLREVVGKSGYELSLQGLSADQVLVLIDGLPITASTGSTVDLSQYLIADVDHIEVVKGASSAQFGSSAMGGVINVITRRQQPGFGGEASVDLGSHGAQNNNGRSFSANNRHARFRAGGGGEQWRLTVSGDRQDNAGFGVDPANYARQGDANDRQQVMVRGEWLPQRSTRAWIEASRYEEDDTQRYNLFVPPVNVPQRKLESITRNRATGGLDWRFDNGARALIKGVTENYDSHSSGYSNDVLATNRLSEQSLQHVSTQVDMPAWGRQLWMFGADWRHETLKQFSNGTSELGIESARHTSAEFFLQNDILLSDAWEVLLGLRGQSDSDFGAHWAPKISVRAKLLEGANWTGIFRASVGQGYRVPNLKERYYLFDHSALGYRVIGNPRLKPESSTSFQLGATFQNANRLSVDVNAFYNRVRDLIQTDLDNATVENGVSSYTYANVSRARTSGFDASVRWRANAALSLNAAYTFTSTKDETTGQALTRRPRDIVRLGADWRIEPSTLLGLRLRHQSSELVDSGTQGRSPAWTTLDLSINHRIGRAITLFAGVNNLTNRQRDFVNPNDFGPVSGRYVYVGARFAFGNSL